MHTPRLGFRGLQPAAMDAPAAPPRKLSPPAAPRRRLSPPAAPPRRLSPPAARARPVNKSPPHPHPPPHRRPPTPTPQRSHLHGQQQQHKQQTSAWSVGFLSAWLSQRTPVLGLRAWVLVAAAAAAVVLAVLVLTVCLCRCRRRRRRCPRVAPSLHHGGASRSMKHHLHQAMADKDIVEESVRWHPPPPCEPPFQPPIEVIKAEQKAPLIRVESARTSGETATSIAGSARGWSSESGGGSDAEADASQRGWGRRYTRRELEEATDGFAAQNVLGEGGYGVVYKGVLRDSTLVAIKNLHNNRGQAEKDFKVEVATIGRVRHKNLVSLLGYCSEGACRMLVYEYMENSNLDKWLHHEEGEISQLNWDTRMHILLGTAKGLAYLHEGLEPKIVHRDVKSSNILLDGQWNARVSDFGLAKLLCSEASYVTTRVMGTFGSVSTRFPCHRSFTWPQLSNSRCRYVAPEYARTGMLNERSDVYSFGVLVMEMITGRTPVDYTRPTAEVNLVEWLKRMVAERRVEEVLDPTLPEAPPSKVLKRAVLAALRCVDPDGGQRPTMGHVVHMLEDDLRFRDELQLARGLSAHASASASSGSYEREE
ncbi:probable serine/threonine-protein kinase At1g01540 isoform X1 [Triticum urartu]|uniref:probable serine/threonine-protein kinase At1g01540 isoform X1 n=1 Tax=Triticum urartu TaxID=4572 RepID=UPI0020447812|nr:probable serine/threonine-protein kinase At1g01540 isoform X1 [Triticum urartu]XP_048531929.1 probable serine/threonine-protein kinase At1g01540 isoform X1 [Triticum urartu]